MEILKIPDEKYFSCNVYLVKKGDEGVLIDAGLQAETMLDFAARQNVKVTACLLTHAHFDHVRGAAELIKSGIPVYVSKEDAKLVGTTADCGERFGEKTYNFAPSKTFSSGETINVSGMSFKTLVTPGHTVGSACFFLDDACFTGDTLFSFGDYGRTDLPSGDFSELKKSLMELSTLLKGKTIYPGHGESEFIAK